MLSVGKINFAALVACGCLLSQGALSFSLSPLSSSRSFFSAKDGAHGTPSSSLQRRPWVACKARGGGGHEDDDRYRDAMSRNRAKTCIRNFLTQRAMQSFFFLLESCRDTATVRWLEDKYEVENLVGYHGSGAFNLTKYPEWDDLLIDLLKQPSDVIVVSTKAKRSGSKNNPYLEDRYIDFSIDIDPPALVQRIISVRDQIAQEWTADLDTLVVANEMILDSYHTTQGQQRGVEVEARMEKQEEETTSTAAVTAEDEQQDDSEDTAEDDDEYDDDDNDEEEEDDDDDFDDETASMRAPYSDTYYEEKVKQQSNKKAYDRTAMMVLGENIGQDGKASSPLRKASFDLLGLLATQESIHRVLREYKEAGEERDVSFEWLRNFYVSRVSKYFDGSQNFYRADDFLEELLLTAPAMKKIGNKLGFIDPMRIAEDIIATRTEVATDWRDITANVATVDHAELRKMVLQIRMGKQFEESVPVTEEEKKKIFEEGFQ